MALAYEKDSFIWLNRDYHDAKSGDNIFPWVGTSSWLIYLFPFTSQTAEKHLQAANCLVILEKK